MSFDRATAAKFEDALASQEASKEYLCVVCVNLDAAGYPRDNTIGRYCANASQNAPIQCM